MEFWNEIIVPALEGIVGDIIGVLPALAGAVTILVVGWIIAKIIAGLVSRLLQKVGLDKIADKAGIGDFLKKSGFKREVSWVVGRLIFWALMLMFLLSSAEALKLTALADTLQKVVGYIPNLIVVILVLVFGTLLARLAGQMVRGAAKTAGIDFADFLGKLVSNFILIAVAVIAISQLEIESAVLDYAFIALLGSFGLAIALTIGLGARDIATGIIHGVYARKTFQIGQRVKIRDYEGRIVQIGTMTSVIRMKKDKVSVPNRELLEGMVELKDSNDS